MLSLQQKIEAFEKTCQEVSADDNLQILQQLKASLAIEEPTPTELAELAEALQAGLAELTSNAVERASTALRRGEFVVVTDGEDRENEGDLILAAEKATPEKLAFMVNHTSGLICCGLTRQRTDELKLPQMVEHNTDAHGTAFTVSVDATTSGVTTGISASDRAATLRMLADPDAMPASFRRPGHMFPLRARDGGVLVRPGHTEAAVDLARLAGLQPAAALCELVNPDGTMMRPAACRAFAKQHGLVYMTMTELITYRRMKEDK